MGKKNNLKKKNNLLPKKNDVDIYSMKSNIINELIDTYNPEPKFNQNGKTDQNYLLDYDEAYKYYISNDFNSNCVSLCIDYLNQTKIKKIFKIEKKFTETFIKIIKDLMMNEFEIILFSLYIDKISWENINNQMDLKLLALVIKDKTNKDTKIIKKKLKSSNSDILSYYNSFLNKFSKEIQENFDYFEINEQIKKLKKPHNYFCKQNYIDYNGVVDKIIELSQPYKGDSRGIQLKKKITYDSLLESKNTKTNFAVNNSEIKEESNMEINYFNCSSIGMNYIGDGYNKSVFNEAGNYSFIRNNLNNSNKFVVNSNIINDNYRLCNENSKIQNSIFLNESKKPENFFNLQNSNISNVLKSNTNFNDFENFPIKNSTIYNYDKMKKN